MPVVELSVLLEFGDVLLDFIPDSGTSLIRRLFLRRYWPLAWRNGHAKVIWTLAKALFHVHTASIVNLTAVFLESPPILSLCIVPLLINQTMIFMVATLSSQMLYGGSIDDIGHSIGTSIHSLLPHPQFLQLLLVMAAESTYRGWPSAYFFFLGIVLLAGLFDLLLIACLATLTPLVAHLLSFLLLQTHLTDSFFLKSHSHGILCCFHLVLDNSVLLMLLPDEASILLASALLLDPTHLSLMLMGTMTIISFDSIQDVLLLFQTLALDLLRQSLLVNTLSKLIRQEVAQFFILLLLEFIGGFILVLKHCRPFVVIAVFTLWIVPLLR